jgi:O-antigen/teichoic acid export membrane protein
MVASFFLQGALQFALVMVVTRVLDAGAAGAFLEAVALFMIVTRWGALGADSGIVRAVPRLRVLGRPAELAPTIAVSVVPVAALGLLAAVGVYAGADQLAAAFFDAGHRGVGAHALRLLAVFIPVWACATVLLAAVRGFGDIAFFAAQNAVLAAVRPPIVAAAALAGLGAAGVALGWAVPTVPTLVVAIVLLRRHLNRVRPEIGAKARPIATIGPEFWAYSLPRALAAVFSVTITWLDVLLVGRLGSTTEAGVYGVASRLYIVGAYALQAVGTAASPQFSELMAAGRRLDLERVYQLGTW